MTKDRSTLLRQCATKGCRGRRVIGKTTCRLCDPTLDASKVKRGLCATRECKNRLRCDYGPNTLFCPSCKKARTLIQMKEYRGMKQCGGMYQREPAIVMSGEVEPVDSAASKMKRRLLLPSEDYEHFSVGKLQHSTPDNFVKMVNKMLGSQRGVQ